MDSRHYSIQGVDENELRLQIVFIITLRDVYGLERLQYAYELI